MCTNALFSRYHHLFCIHFLNIYFQLLAARTITNDIYSFQQALKNIPLFMLHFIFSQHSSSNLIRLKYLFPSPSPSLLTLPFRFTYPELNNRLISFIKSSTLVLFYLSEKRKTCTKVDDLVELSSM